MQASKLWPAALVAVLAITVAANGFILYAANDDPNGSAVERDYYRKGVEWDSTMADEARGRSLGWKLQADCPGWLAGKGAEVRVRVSDGKGSALGGAAVRVEAIHNLEAATPVTAALAEGPAGDYRGILPLDRGGRWELRLDVRRGGQHFRSVVHRDLGALSR